VTHAKPNPEVYDKAVAALGLPDEARPFTLAFEDDPRGIMSAKAAGLYTCAITTRFTKAELASLEVAPDLIAESYAEFEQLLGLSQ
jgi:beta-phosphoglucomutase-like phosphatase (HAD superfamily)